MVWLREERITSISIISGFSPYANRSDAGVQVPSGTLLSSYLVSGLVNGLALLSPEVWFTRLDSWLISKLTGR